MENYIDDSRIHEGHRSRMRAKLLTHGQRIFDTYELLEMLLYHMIPYKDTNPLSKRLLAAFGSLEGVLSASREELAACLGIGERTADFLTAVGTLGDIIGAEILVNTGPNLSSYDAVGAYLTEYFSGVSEKQVIALYLDSGMHLKCVKKLYDLEYESGGVKAKPFIDGAIENSAAVVITAHNHPYGPFYPTQGDRATNKVITDTLKMYGIVHAEHYIICGEHYAGIGSLENFAAKLSQMPAVSRFFDSIEREEPVCRMSAISEEKKVFADVGHNLADSDFFVRLLGFVSGDLAGERAELLLGRFHSIENTLTASAKELSALTDDKCAFYLKLLAYVTSRRVTDGFKTGRVYSRAEIAEYLKALFLGEPIEKTYVLGFDGKDRFLGCELVGEGTVSASEVIPRRAVDAAAGLSASRVVIAHNHPFGTTRASADDLNVTKQFEALFASCGMKLVDHFILAGQLCDTIDF
ncbi:MAG: hypothetical protein IKJ25_06120 [Clostridia bacterium]|nr:hypothetical protein [Clostridia bacterium]